MSQSVIADVRAREVLNFRGYPTVEAEVVLESGTSAFASSPAGITAGASEARQLVDGDTGRYEGQGVFKAVGTVHEKVAPALRGVAVTCQADVDKVLLELDATDTKEILGGNVTLAVSLAAAHAAARDRRQELFEYLGAGPYRLPRIWFNMFAGGGHAANSADLQEYLVGPAPRFSLSETLEIGTRVYRALRRTLVARGLAVQEMRGGALSAPVRTNEQPLELVAEAIERAGYSVGDDCELFIDAAASHMHRGGLYEFPLEGVTRSAGEMVEFWKAIVAKFGVVCIEDAMAEEDWDGWRLVTAEIGDTVQLVGDDLFTTNPARVRRGVALKAGNSLLVKPNQVGTLTETLEAMAIARAAGWQRMLSTRSGETEDCTVADLAVLADGGQIKTGPPWRQVVLKHNRLLRIAEAMERPA